MLKGIKRQWAVYQQASLSNQSILAISNKQLEKMEWIKQVLDTEYKLIEEEKKKVEQERKAILDHKSKEKANFLATGNSDSFDFINSSMKGSRHKYTESEINRTKDKLEIEIEVLEKLNEDVRQELDRINDEK